MKRQLLSPCLLEEKRERKAKHVPKKSTDKACEDQQIIGSFVLHFELLTKSIVT